MEPDELRAYVERSRELVESSPELSERNTQLRLVQPFLTALGWELHQVAADYRVETGDRQVAVDFALLLDGEPAVLVETAACAEPLQREQAARLGRTLLDSGVDRGILTNGRGFVFVATAGGDLERFECRLADLPEHHDAVSEYTRRAAERRREAAARHRRDAAAALAAARDDVVEDLTARLVETAGDGVARSLRGETERFVDSLIASFGGSTDEILADETPAARTSSEHPTGSERDAGTAGDNDGTIASDSDATTSGDADAEARDGPDAPDDDADVLSDRDVPDDALGGAVAADGQYVVRFFGRRTSVWAVGHARAAMTAAQAIEYLLQRGSFEGSLTTPWGPDDEQAVLRGERIPNASIELSDDVHLDARVPLPVAREAIEALADRAGLRAMFQGEWPDAE